MRRPWPTGGCQAKKEKKRKEREEIYIARLTPVISNGVVN
jgi:hypothetical protein